MSRITELLGMRDEAEVAEFQAQYDASVQEQIEEAWTELQAVPSYVERNLYAEEQYYCGLCGRMREISHFPH